MLYTIRPANLGSGATTPDMRAPAAAFGAPPINTRADASKFSFEVGEKFVASVGCVSLAPPFTTSPGTFSRAMEFAPVPPFTRGCSPAENPAARETGGAGTSIVFAGFSPTMAIDASATPRTPTAGASATAGAAAISSAPIRAAIVRERCSFTSGASASVVTLAAARFSAGATKPRTGPRGTTGAPRSATMSECFSFTSGASASIVTFAAARFSAGATKPRTARRGTTGAPITAATVSARCFTSGASANVATFAAARFSAGAANGRTTFGGATATTFGSGIAFGAATSGSGAQIKVAAFASSRAPDTIVCGALSRARAGRASGLVSAGAISGSFSRKLYHTILFSCPRIS